MSFVLAILGLTAALCPAIRAESISQAEVLERLDQLEKKVEARDARIEQLEAEIERLKNDRVEPGMVATPVTPTGEIIQAAPAPATSLETPAPEQVAAAQEPAAEEEYEEDRYWETWGHLDPGKGFLVGRNSLGELRISAYAMVRYLNQWDDDGVFTDHLGREHPVDQRQDIYAHRAIVYLHGWAGTPRLTYQIIFWTVNTTDQDALFGNIGYRFHKAFNLYAGINGNPGTRSLLGSHPYWLGHDRVMADEFFRPFFTQGVWANGEVLPGLWYNASIGNSSSILGVTAVELDRELTYGGSVWWMPTTREFGPRGAYGDWEWHEKLATRFGVSTVYSPEERYDPIGSPSGNTSIKLADSLNLFDVGALADGVTVTDADYYILSADAGLKYKGIFLQTEYYHRWLNDFKADGFVPLNQIEDQGFYVQAAFFPWRKKVELYTATSQIFGDREEGFGHSAEYLAGVNYYVADSRHHRINVQYIYVEGSPVGSTFGYYTAGQTGSTVSVAASIFF